jgi:uncharacterized protein
MPILDVLRGFSLFGVLATNMLGFSGFWLLSRAEVKAITGGIDGIALIAIDALFRRKSLTLLSFLFGLGFALQIEHAEARGARVIPLYLRRLAALFAIGAGHATLLWWGDQLTIYAITGVVLLLFRRCSVRALLLWAAFFILVPQLVGAVPAISRLLEPADPHEADVFAARMLSALRAHDPTELFRLQARQAIRSQWSLAAWQYSWTLGRFLVGYAAGRSRLFRGGEERLPFFRKLFGWGLGLGLAGTSVMVVRRVLSRRGTTLHPALDLALLVPEEVGVLALTAAYLAALVLLMERPAWKRRLMVLAPVGQTALTCYLMQSVICALVFDGWGLGLLGRVRPALFIPLALVIFAAQIVASRLWLTRFRFGPFEWLWRSLTYGKQPILRQE